MTCLAPEQLAMLASGGVDEVAADHVTGCLSCRALLDEQRAQRSLLAALAIPSLSPARRETLAAEIMARMDHADGEHAAAMHAGSRTRVVVVGLGLVAAAAVALVLLGRPGSGTERPRRSVAEVVPVSPAPPRDAGRHELAPAPGDAPGKPGELAIAPAAPPARDDAAVRDAARVTGDGEYTVKARGARDVLTLRTGSVSVDAVASRPLRIMVGATTIAVRDAKLDIVSRRGVIAQVTVFAGSVQLAVDGRQVVVSAGETWEPPAPPTTGAAAFRDAWTALREERYDDAIAAFDRADDSVVAEDALYWSAIACERAGRHGEAVARYRRLVAQYPDSPRVVEARAAIARE